MADKEWTVTHPRARAQLTLRGKSLKEALEKAGLNPDLWKPITPLQSEESPPSIVEPDLS